MCSAVGRFACNAFTYAMSILGPSSIWCANEPVFPLFSTFSLRLPIKDVNNNSSMIRMTLKCISFANFRDISNLTCTGDVSGLFYSFQSADTLFLPFHWIGLEIRVVSSYITIYPFKYTYQTIVVIRSQTSVGLALGADIFFPLTSVSKSHALKSLRQTLAFSFGCR